MCSSHLYSNHLKQDECWNCGADISSLKKDGAGNTPSEPEPKPKLKSNLEDENNSISNKEYPALAFLSKLANFIAWVGFILSILGFFIYVDSLYNPPFEALLFPLFGLAIGTFIFFVFWRAISEILILFVDIAKDVRKISLKE